MYLTYDLTQPTKTGEKSNNTHEIDFFYSQKIEESANVNLFSKF
jgi:hypothetical protein